MLIRRGHHSADFTILPNRTIRDDRLSYMARGLLAEILSRPDGWETTADQLWRKAQRDRPGAGHGEGRRAFRAVFAELRERGYMHRARSRGDDGLWRTVQVVFDTPQNSPFRRGTGSGTPETGTPESGTSETGTFLRSTDHPSTEEEATGRPSNSPAPEGGVPPPASAARARENASWPEDPWAAAEADDDQPWEAA